MQSLSTQLFAFTVTILIGFLIGVLFDLYRVGRGLIKPKKIITYVGDIIFWLISTVVIFLSLLIGNWGEMRLYVFIGILIGSALYLNYVSSSFIKVILLIIKVFRNIKIKVIGLVRFLYKIIIYPITVISSTVIIPIGFISKNIVLPVKASLRRIIKKYPLQFRKKHPPKE